MGERRFGTVRPVVVLDGADTFRPLGGPGDDPRIYVMGTPLGSGAGVPAIDAAAGDGFGRFLVLRHHIRDGVVEVYGDRWTSLPLYVATTATTVYLATRLRAFLDAGVVPSAIDRTALAEALAFDFPLGDRTLLAGVRALPGGTALRIAVERAAPVAVERTWRAEEAVCADPVPFAEAKDALLETFLEGCQRATADADRVAITLSGGMDSRCLLAAALTLGRPVRSVHMSEPGGRADVYARRMAAACGVPHEAYAPSPVLAHEYYDRLGRLVARHEGMVLEPETEVSWLRDQMPDDVVMLHGGYAELSKLGDLRRFHVTGRLARAEGAALVSGLWARFAGPFEMRLRAFTPAVATDLRARARTSFSAYIEAIAGRRPLLDAARIVQVAYLEEQVKVEKYSGHMWNARLRTRFPFSFPRYVDLLLRVPVRDRLQQTFQMHLLRRLQPALYRVPDANTGVRVDAPGALRFLVRAVSKIRRDLLGSRRVQEHADVRGWIGAVRPPLGAALVRDLDPALYDRAGLERVMAEMARRHHAGEALQAVVLFEAWRAYVGLRAPLGDPASP